MVGYGMVSGMIDGPALWQLIEQRADREGISVTAWCRNHLIPDSTVHKWRTGTNPSVPLLERAARALGLDPHQLGV